jgi:hypothetical protein
MLEAKSSDESGDENIVSVESSMNEKMNSFMNQIDNFENKKLEKQEIKRKKREEKEKAKIEPSKKFRHHLIFKNVHCFKLMSTA